jgi:hypothetical protein
LPLLQTTLELAPTASVLPARPFLCTP